MTNNIKTQAETIESAKNCALNYLSYKPRTTYEVKKKLKDKGFDGEVISIVIEFLKEYKFIDDDAYAHLWIRNRINLKPTGRIRLRNELYQRGLDKDTIERNIGELTPELEEELALSLAQKRIERTGSSIRKVEGFLFRRGFKPELVRKIISALAVENSK